MSVEASDGARLRVVVTGAAGQDGSYMCEALVAAGHEVIGVVRSGTGTSSPNTNLAAVRNRMRLLAVDLDDAGAVAAFVDDVQPDRVFHLAGESFVGGGVAAHSFHVSSTLALLEALHTHAPECRFVLAGSAVQRAGATTSPQSESTPPAPTSTYGLAKQLACEAVAWFRSHHGMHASTALLYNHESPRRQARFVTKKLAAAAARIARGLEKHVELGDVKAVRDWGWAPDYVDAMLRMAELPRDKAQDFVIASGTGRTVADFADAAFRVVGLRAKDHIVVREDLVRPSESVPLVGNASRARSVLAWRATVPFEEIAQRMVEAELALLDNAGAGGGGERAPS